MRVHISQIWRIRLNDQYRCGLVKSLWPSVTVSLFDFLCKHHFTCTLRAANPSKRPCTRLHATTVDARMCGTRIKTTKRTIIHSKTLLRLNLQAAERTYCVGQLGNSQAANSSSSFSSVAEKLLPVVRRFDTPIAAQASRRNICSIEHQLAERKRQLVHKPLSRERVCLRPFALSVSSLPVDGHLTADVTYLHLI